MEELIVGRLTKKRALLERECAITSDIDFTIHAYSNKSITVQPVDDLHSVPDNFEEQWYAGAGGVNEIPFGIAVTPSVDIPPKPEAFNYLFAVGAAVGRETPLSLTGAQVGETGRQQDISRTIALQRYEGMVEGVSNALSTSFEMALKICEEMPTLYPSEWLKRNDTKYYTEILIDLKPEDPIEADRKATLGSRLVSMHEISPITNLVRYKGYTLDEAEAEMVDMLKWRVLLESPEIARLIGMRAAEKSGMAEYLKMLQTQPPTEGMLTPPPPSGMQRAQGEVGTPIGKELSDAFMGGYGQRQSPQRYTRGGGA